MGGTVVIDSSAQRTQRIRLFLLHLGVYVVVSAGLLTLNLLQTPETLWSLYVIIGWGIAVGLHALSAFVGEEPMQIKEEGDDELTERHRKAS